MRPLCTLRFSESSKESQRDHPLTQPSGYRPLVIIDDYERTIYANGPLRNSDPSRWGYGFTKADVTAAQRELRAAGIQLPWEIVDAALHAVHFGERN
jgi:hypothetical protein